MTELVPLQEEESPPREKIQQVGNRALAGHQAGLDLGLRSLRNSEKSGWLFKPFSRGSPAHRGRVPNAVFALHRSLSTAPVCCARITLCTCCREENRLEEERTRGRKTSSEDLQQQGRDVALGLDLRGVGL